MNPLPPLIPPLHVSAAYVALANKALGSHVMAALRSPGQALALAHLWDVLRSERDALDPADQRLILAVSDVVYHLTQNLRAERRDASFVVGITVKILTPPPDPGEGQLWTRPGVGAPWGLRNAADIPDGWQTEAVPHLAAVCHYGDAFTVVGYDGVLATYAEAAGVSGLVGIIAASGLTSGLLAAMSAARRGEPGAEQALDLAKRLSAAVEGL